MTHAEMLAEIARLGVDESATRRRPAERDKETMTVEQMQAEIARLTAENARLAPKRGEAEAIAARFQDAIAEVYA